MSTALYCLTWRVPVRLDDCRSMPYWILCNVVLRAARPEGAFGVLQTSIMFMPTSLACFPHCFSSNFAISRAAWGSDNTYSNSLVCAFVVSSYCEVSKSCMTVFGHDRQSSEGILEQIVPIRVLCFVQGGMTEDHHRHCSK